MIQFMQGVGLEVDLSHFAGLETHLTREMDRLTEEVRGLSGRYTNLGSGPQVSELLFKHFGLKQARIKMTPSGDRESVESEVLNAIKHDHPAVMHIIDYKECEKLIGTYVRPIPKLAVHTAFGTWRLFPNYRTTRVPSGRLSAYDPNLLAMPTRTKRGGLIRKGFPSRPGWKIVSIDESQIEVRMAAYRSKDPGLISVYQNDQDIYSDFAIEAFSLLDNRYCEGGKWYYPSVDRSEHRRPSKTCVLAALYDVTAAGLLEQMPVVCANCKQESIECSCGRFRSLWTEDKCQDLLNKFYIKYPGIITMRKMDHGRAKRFLRVWDMWGRFIFTYGVKSVHSWIQSKALRECANHPMQAGAQGTIKLTMASVMDILEDGHMLEVVNPLLQVHDELLFEAREDVVDELIYMVGDEFANCVRLDEVPIRWSGTSALTWGDLEK